MADNTTMNREQQLENDDDRREFFRIDDSIHLSYQRIPSEDIHQRLERLEHGLDSDFTIVSTLAAITQRMAGTLHQIESVRPGLASYLRSLDEKIEVLGRAFLVQNTDIADQPAHAVNLSATGMAFHAAESIDQGVMLELKILLMPSVTGILTYAEVVGCDEIGDESEGLPYTLRVNFSHLRGDDRDVLIRHVVQRQSALLRKQREMREAE
ncbi:MAG: PilZ domain-containing protein [Sedimenticola sp.]